MDQDAIIVGRIPQKSKGKRGLKRIESGIPDKFFDLRKYFKVIDREPSIIDEDLNERIQREGAHCNGAGDEAQWYSEHKGYSRNL